MLAIEAGSASDRLMREDCHAETVWPAMMPLDTPETESAFNEPAESNSSVPVADGKRLKLPVRLISPEKAVARSSGGSTVDCAVKISTRVSASRSQGWKNAALELPESRFWRASQTVRKDWAEVVSGSVTWLRRLRSPASEEAFTPASSPKVEKYVLYQ